MSTIKPPMRITDSHGNIFRGKQKDLVFFADVRQLFTSKGMDLALPAEGEREEFTAGLTDNIITITCTKRSKTSKEGEYEVKVRGKYWSN